MKHTCVGQQRSVQLLFASFYLLILLCAGCGTFKVPVKYVASATQQNDLGKGKAVQLHVLDARPETALVGTTADVYKQRIEPSRPVSASVEEAFRLALSRANYVLSDTAELTYEVKILRFEVGWAAEFFSKFTTTVDLQVSLNQNGRQLGEKVFRQPGAMPNKLGSDKAQVAAQLLSATMSDAVNRAVQDAALVALIRNGDITGRLAATERTSRPAPTQERPTAKRLAERDSEPEPEGDWRVGIDADLEERNWNQALLKNTSAAYLEYYRVYTNTARMKVLSGTLKAEMGMEFSFGTQTRGPQVKKITLSLVENPSFEKEVSVEDAARWKIINYEPLGENAAKIGTKEPMPNTKVILVKQRNATSPKAGMEFKVVAVELADAHADIIVVPSVEEMKSGAKIRVAKTSEVDSAKTGKSPERNTESERQHFEEIKARAERGEAEAQFTLAGCYAKGEGVGNDAVEAIKWYRKSAEQGNPNAQFSLAFRYAKGEGVDKDAVEAVKWFRKAAEQGNASAQLNLGVRYASGDGVTKDPVQAVEWYRKAADQGFAAGQYNLGVSYDNGDGVTRDVVEAVKWYRRAAEQGLAAAQSNLGVCYDKGEGVPRDQVEAVKWYRMAAEQNDAGAQYNLGLCYANSEGVTRDSVKAHQWFALALAQGEENAKKPLIGLEKSMTIDQIAEARELARAFKPRKEWSSNKEVAAKAEFPPTPTNWPKYSGELAGSMEVRVKNPNNFVVTVGLRSEGKGRDFRVAGNDTESVRVSNGRYEIYFHYSTDPEGLYQGDGFTLNDNGVEIQIVKVVNGNYGIRKVK